MSGDTTPETIANRPGLTALACRVGTFASFLATMKGRLSSSDYEALHTLTTRVSSDFSIALLDAWAIVADVLTFYQERIANEGYLRTATERRSILELARLVGYEVRPGVASSVYVAYALDEGSRVDIPAGSRAQSVPGPGELPQAFETAASLHARWEWNNLQVRRARPPLVTETTPVIYLDGITANLKPNDPVLFVTGGGTSQLFASVQTVDIEPTENRTKVVLQRDTPPAKTQDVASAGVGGERRRAVTRLRELIEPLRKSPAAHPPDPAALHRDAAAAFGLSGGTAAAREGDVAAAFDLEGDTAAARERDAAGTFHLADTAPALLATLFPEVGGRLYKALAGAVPPTPAAEVYALRVTAAPFGHNAPLRPILDDRGSVLGSDEWPLEYATVTISSRPGANGPLTGGTVTIREAEQTGSVTFSDLQRVSEPMRIGGRRVTIQPLDGGFEVEIGGLTKTSVIAQGAVISVRVNDDDAFTVRPGRTVRYSTDAYRVAAASIAPRAVTRAALTGGPGETPSLTVTEEVVLPPTGTVLWLDAAYDQIVRQSWVAVERPDEEKPRIMRIKRADKASRAEYGMSGRVTRLELEKTWLDPNRDRMLSAVRRTTVYAQSEALKLVDGPITDDVTGERIELDGLYGELEPGRWLIVEGDRMDAAGVHDAELVMLAGVEHKARRPGGPGTPEEPVHTTLVLAERGLRYTYKRDTVKIHGNVVRATHGETRAEVLGSGDGAQALQQFSLRMSPLTYVPAPTPSGVQSTLEVRVNDVRWHLADAFAGLGPRDCRYLSRTDDDGKTTVVFGDGLHGARLPTGVENVTAVYRTGIGKPGNVRAAQISLLASRPLGVRSVVNPLPATGGADAETRDQARRNAPLAVAALDRLVSVQDYADFTRTFAGIGKATAVRLAESAQDLVHVTIAGADDIPISADSDLITNLDLALQKFGDPHVAVRVDVYRARLIVIGGGVRLLEDFRWESVSPKIRAALLDAFGFERREFGQDVLLSEIITVIQSVAGVAYVDVDLLTTIERESIGEDAQIRTGVAPGPRKPPESIPVQLARIDPAATNPDKRYHPAELAFLTPRVPATLALNELPA